MLAGRGGFAPEELWWTRQKLNKHVQPRRELIMWYSEAGSVAQLNSPRRSASLMC